MIKNLARGPVDLFNGVAVGTVFGFALEVLGRSDGDVREIVSEVEEERFALMLVDVLDRLLRVIRRDVIPALHGFHNDLLIAHDRAAHRRVLHQDGEAIEARGAVEVVEALGIRHGRRIEASGAFAVVAEVPFADDPRRITRRFQHLRHRDLLRMRHGVELFHITRFSDANRIRSRHQRRPRHPTNRLRVETRQPQTFRSHPVEVGCLDFGRAKATQIVVALIIREDEDDARLGRRRTDGHQ